MSEEISGTDTQTAQLVGIRLREPAKAEDHLLEGFTVHVGELCVVEVQSGTGVGEVRRPPRPLPDFKRDRVFPRVVRLATAQEVARWKEWREREKRARQT
ncbi:MAG: hypothetical protein AAB285_02760, partial [candidate division NC10 bacterium]